MAQVMLMKTSAEQALDSAFAAARTTLPGDPAVRDAAFARYAAQGLPHRRVEAWKYTDLRAAMRDAAPLAAPPTGEEAGRALSQSLGLPGVSAPTIAFVNGHMVGSLPAVAAGIEVVQLAHALVGGHPLLSKLGGLELARGDVALSLNTAFMSDGLVVHVAAGVKVEAPLHLSFLTSANHPLQAVARVLVVLEEGASLSLLETHEGPQGVAYQTNMAVETFIGDHARLDHVRVSRDGSQALALSTLTARLGVESELVSSGIVTGSATSRHQVYVGFHGENAKLMVSGASLLNHRQHVDNTLVVEHAEPGGESREVFKTIVDDEATGVFQGKIIVHSKAQKTDGRMMSGALLLSEGATMNNKPELEIFADDVQCAHGATCGQLDDDLLFYLMARGLPRREAEALLLQAFAGEAIEPIANDEIKSAFADMIAGWLKQRAQR
jgi:Fe-S cluster assembly protein SufD